MTDLPFLWLSEIIFQLTKLPENELQDNCVPATGSISGASLLKNGKINPAKSTFAFAPITAIIPAD